MSDHTFMKQPRHGPGPDFSLLPGSPVSMRGEGRPLPASCAYWPLNVRSPVLRDREAWLEAQGLFRAQDGASLARSHQIPQKASYFLLWFPG